MAQRRHHYEQAFEHFLRARRIPYVSVDEARRALLPGPLRSSGDPPGSLKSFDFVIYGSDRNALVEIKGRRVRATKSGGPGRLESWTTEEDVRSLQTWGSLFGAAFEPAIVFVYWCDEMPGSALFEEVFEFQGRWYAVRAVSIAEYAGLMRPRSKRWGTVHLSKADFDRVARPVAPPPSGMHSPASDQILSETAG